MITQIRRSFKSRTYKIFLWITFLAVAGVFSVLEMARNYFMGGSTTAGWVLQVNNTTFSTPDFMRAVNDQEERIKMLRSQYGQYADFYMQMMGMATDPKLLALNSLTRKALLNQAASELHLIISNEKAQEYLKDPLFIYQELSDLIPFFTWDRSTGGINPLLLSQYHRQMGIITSEFEAQTNKAVERELLKKLVEHSAYTPEFELKEQFAQTFLGRKFSVATISGDQILNRVKKEPVTDEQLKAYYKSASSQDKRYYMPEKRFLKIYSFSPSGYGINVTNDEIERYYNANKAHYVEKPAQVQVRRILLNVPVGANETEVYKKAEALRQQVLAKPETFAAVAKENSADSKTAAQGGLMPSFSKGTHDRNFEKAAFTLAKEGDISSVVKTNEGYEFLQLVSKKAQTFKPVTQVSADISKLLINKKFNDQFTSDVRAALLKADQKMAIAQLSKDKNGIDEASKDVNADNSALSKTAFRLKKGESSYYIEGGKGYVITLVAIKESFLPALEVQKAQVLQDYYADKARKELSAIIARSSKEGLYKELKDELKFEKTGLIRHSHDFKGDEQEKQALTKKGYDLGRMFQIENIGGMAAYQVQGNGYFIRLDEVAPFDPVLYEQKKNDLKSSLLSQKKSFTMAGFVASLYRNAKINKNESLIRNEQ